MTLPIKILRYFAFFWILVLSLGTLYSYINFNANTSFLQLKKTAIESGYYLPAFYSHIFFSSIILMAGFFQFSESVYKNRPLHKALGKLYVFGVLFFAAPGAYVMTLFINRGEGVFMSFLIQNTLWVVFTIAAWILIKKRKIEQHVQMMKRSYSLAFAAVTLRFYIFLFTVFGTGVNFKYNYLIIAFLSWVPNLLLVELINYYNKNRIKDIV